MNIEEKKTPFCNGLAFTSFILQTCCIKESKSLKHILFQFVCVYEHIKYIVLSQIHWFVGLILPKKS